MCLRFLRVLFARKPPSVWGAVAAGELAGWRPGGSLNREARGLFAEAEERLRLDIVIPAHNEEGRIGPTLDAYRARCAGPEVRFLVALDRCTDRTAEVVSAHAEA